MAFYKNHLFKNISIVAFSYGLAQLLLVVATPFLTRIYDPVFFATFGYIVSAANIFLALASLRYEYAIPLMRSPASALALARLCNRIVWLSSTIILCIAWIFLLYFPNMYLSNKSLLVLCFLVLLLQGLLQVYTMPLLAQGKVLQVSYGKILQNLGMIVIQILIPVFWHSSAEVLIFGLIFGLFINLIYYRAVLSQARQHIKLSKLRLIFFLKKYYNFPLYSSWAGVIDAVSTLMPVFLIGPWYGARALGLYFLVVRVFSAPIGLLAKSVSQVMIKELADRVKARKEVLSSFIKITAVLLIIALFYGALMFGMSFWAGLLFGNDWLAAGPIIRILAPVIAIILCVSPLTVIFGILQKNKIGSLWQVLYLLATVLVVYLNKGQAFLHMLIYLACVWFLLYVLYWLMMFKVILSHKRMLCAVSSA